MNDSERPATSRLPFRSLPLAQREVALLIVLSLTATAMFVGTARLAAWSRGRQIQAAAQWFDRGQELVQAGNLDVGVASLREAVAANRQNPRYALALAASLAALDRTDEARRLLLQLRQKEPDDVEINYRLARLTGQSGDQAAAIRYYDFAMYGVPRIGAEFDRRQIRAELVGFLLDHGERQEAITEIGALGREIGDDLPSQLQAARLAVRAEMTRQALDFYTQAGTIEPTSAEAAAGAGEAAFALRDYATAARSLDRAISLGAPPADLASHAATAHLVLSTDPLGPRLSRAERARRLTAGATSVAARYKACQQTKVAAPPAAAGAPPAPDSTLADLQRVGRQAATIAQDSDELAQAVGLISAAAAAIPARCPDVADPADRIWALIAGIHQGGRP